MKPGTTGIFSRNGMVKSPDTMAITSEPKRAKWANDPFSMFVH